MNFHSVFGNRIAPGRSNDPNCRNKTIMKAGQTKVVCITLTVLSMAFAVSSARALEVQTLLNFELSPGTVTGSLVQGPDGNFYGTTAQGGPRGSGTVFRVTPAGVLTTLVSDQANPAASVCCTSQPLDSL